MAIKVLVVDDSSFFRRRLSEILTKDGDIEIIDTANNGREGVDKALALRPDVITMDVEMPVLDGISAVREIMQQQRIPILMFSSLTHEGAKATLDALEAGAVDFLPKKFEDIARDKDEAGQLLRDRVKAVARKRQLGRPTFSSTLRQRVDSPATTPISERPSLTRSSFERPKLNERVGSATGRFQPSGKPYKLVA
ncbi:MAG: response regulator, partial [Rheinheimera sp.]|nr:response regulator [Rheinheimera sp.]